MHYIFALHLEAEFGIGFTRIKRISDMHNCKQACMAQNIASNKERQEHLST